MTFFDSYSYQKKNYALLVLVVLLLAVIYKKAILKTQETLAYKSELKLKLDRAASAIPDIQMKQRHIASLNEYIGKENNTVEKVQQGFLNFFARKANGLSVYQIDEVQTYKHPDFAIKTHRIILKGGYTSALKFIHELESDFDLARLINVSFAYEKYPNDEKEDLYTTILLQNYLR
jgi:hypothetical protein